MRLPSMRVVELIRGYLDDELNEISKMLDEVSTESEQKANDVEKGFGSLHEIAHHKARAKFARELSELVRGRRKSIIVSAADVGAVQEQEDNPGGRGP